MTLIWLRRPEYLATVVESSRGCIAPVERCAAGTRKKQLKQACAKSDSWPFAVKFFPDSSRNRDDQSLRRTRRNQKTSGFYSERRVDTKVIRLIYTISRLIYGFKHFLRASVTVSSYSSIQAHTFTSSKRWQWPGRWGALLMRTISGSWLIFLVPEWSWLVLESKTKLFTVYRLMQFTSALWNFQTPSIIQTCFKLEPWTAMCRFAASCYIDIFWRQASFEGEIHHINFHPNSLSL